MPSTIVKIFCSFLPYLSNIQMILYKSKIYSKNISIATSQSKLKNFSSKKEIGTVFRKNKTEKLSVPAAGQT